MNLMLTILILFIYQQKLAESSHCWITSENTAKCSTVPSCDDINIDRKNVESFHINENVNKIEQNLYENCPNIFDRNIKLFFKSISIIQSDAFNGINVNHNLNIKIDGNKEENLNISQNAFTGISLDRLARLTIEISNYNRVLIKDILIGGVLQREKSEINVVIQDCNDLIIDGSHSRTHLAFVKDTSYSLRVKNVRKIDLYSLANIEISSSSRMDVFIEDSNIISLEDNLFEKLILSSYSKFTVSIKNTDFIGFGINIFKGLQLDDSSDFRFSINGVNKHLNLSNCLDIKENFFKTMKLLEGAFLQLNFTHIAKHIQIDKNAFNDIILAKDSKIQIVFNHVESNIIFHEYAINKVELNDGLIEILTQNHALHQTAYFILNNYSISSIYFTPESRFKMSFLKSNGLALTNEKSFYRWKKSDFSRESNKSSDYLTRLTLNFDNSEKILFKKTLVGPDLIEIENNESINNLENEFCQYAGLFQSNLVYFSSLFVSFSNLKCSSCLLMLLYRNAHRKNDFYSIKKYIPNCFKMKFYGNNSELVKYQIDDNLNREWRLENCEDLTGMKNIDDEFDMNYVAKNTCQIQIPIAIREPMCYESSHLYEILIHETHLSKAKKGIIGSMVILLCFTLIALGIIIVYKKRNEFLTFLQSTNGYSRKTHEEELDNFSCYQTTTQPLTSFDSNINISNKSKIFRSLFNFSSFKKENYQKLDNNDEDNSNRRKMFNVIYNVKNETSTVKTNQDLEEVEAESEQVNVISNPIERLSE
jgi:hypothetical protein